jgi:hypothetical protein
MKPARSRVRSGPRLQTGANNGAQETFIELGQRLAAMDARAVDMEILSINTFRYNRERDLAAQIVKLQNEEMAESAQRTLIASQPSPLPSYAERSDHACMPAKHIAASDRPPQVWKLSDTTTFWRLLPARTARSRCSWGPCHSRQL